MPIQRIKFGDIVISSRELNWEDIRRLSTVLKKFAKWNPEEKIWITTWRVFTRIDEIITNLNSVENLDRDYIVQLMEKIEELNSTENMKLINGKIAILAKNIDPFDFVRNYGGKVKFIKLKYSFGEFEVPYILLSKDKLDSVPEPIRERIIDFIEKEKRKVKLGFVSFRRLRIEFLGLPPIGLIHQLKNLGTVRYYYEDIEGNVLLREQTYYKEKTEDDHYVVYLPSYAYSFVLDLVKKYGYSIESNVQIKNSMDINLNKSFELYEHQNEAYLNWKNKRGKGTIVIPTGGGKTHIALQAIYELKVPTIVFVPNTLLLNQWVNKIAKFLGVPKGLIGVLGKGEKKIRDITVATYQSGYKNIEMFWNKFSMAIFDEAHHIPAQTFKQVALYLPAPYRMALSATPKRRDKNEVLLFKLVGDVVYKIEYRDLVIRGIVAPLIVRKILVPLPANLLLEYSSIQRELYRAKNPIEKKKILNKLIAIARDNPLKIEVIREIVERNKENKMFIFAGSIEFAEKIEKAIKSITPTAALTSKTDTNKEKRIQDAFRRGILKALILVKKGEEGVDVGDASIAIIAGGSKQEREFIQRVGRVLRGGKDKLAWVYEIVTKDTVEESISKSRQARNLVRGLEDIIWERFRIKAYDEIYWRPKQKIQSTF